MKKGWMLFCCAMLLCAGCHNGDQPVQERTVADAEEVVEKVRTVEVYTFGKVSDGLLHAMLDSLQAHYPKCVFMKNLPLPESAYYAPRNRYLADGLNDYLTQFRTDDNIVVGLTEVDISMNNFRNSPNFGIMGKANSIGGRVAVFSKRRVKNYAELFALMEHEIGHAVGLRHCPNSSCLMQNAKGKNKFGSCKTFCSKCRAFMEKNHWHF